MPIFEETLEPTTYYVTDMEEPDMEMEVEASEDKWEASSGSEVQTEYRIEKPGSRREDFEQPHFE